MRTLILIFLLLIPSISHSQSIKKFYDSFQHERRKSCQNTKTNQVLIDDKNAFIQIQNPEMPGDVIRFKCFTAQDQSKVFGFQYDDSQPGIGLEITRTEFYVLRDKKWQEVTYEVYPTLGFKSFWGEQALPNQQSQQLNIDLVLPREGTTIMVESSPAVAVQFPYNILPNGYEEVIQKRKYKTIELNWNSKAGEFEIGRKF